MITKQRKQTNQRQKQQPHSDNKSDLCYRALIHIHSIGVWTVEAALKGPTPAEVCATTRTEYPVLGMRPVNTACLLEVMMLLVVNPGVLR